MEFGLEIRDALSGMCGYISRGIFNCMVFFKQALFIRQQVDLVVDLNMGNVCRSQLG